MPMPSAPPQAAVRIDFGKQQPDDAASAGADRGADGDLVLARSPLRNHEYRDVGARDEKRQQYGGAEDVGQHERHLLTHGRPFEPRSA